MPAEIRKVGALRWLAGGCALAWATWAVPGCTSLQIDFSPLDAGVDAAGVAPREASSDAPEPFDALPGPPSFDARGDDAAVEVISACAPEDPTCEPCGPDHVCSAGVCRPGFNYCVDCTDQCQPGEVCVGNMCLQACSPMKPCQGHEECDPSGGFCRMCDFNFNFNLCDPNQVCRNKTGQCVECVSNDDCAPGQACSVRFTCYDAGAEGGPAEMHDR